MAEDSRWRSFREVDETVDPGLMSNLLDDIASVPGVAAQKRRSLELLGVAEGSSVLDIGCGNGTDLGGIAELVGRSGRVVGVDRSRALIDDARARVPCSLPIEVVVADAESLPFDDATFDAARADRTLQHLPHVDAALSEMARVVRTGGRLVATESQWVLDAPQLDPEVTRIVLGVFETDDERRQWLGYLLPILFDMAGLTEVVVESSAYRTSDPAEFSRLIDFEWCVAQAVKRDLISPDRGESWARQIRDLPTSGEASAVLSIIHVSGTKS